MPIYNSLSTHLRARFGEAVLKIPVNGGFSCPNRDGTLGTAGCSFCDARSFSPVALSVDEPLRQLRAGMSRSRSRFGKFIAYLQPYSNTYASVEVLRAVYEPLLAEPGVVGLAVGTRPDCLPPDIVSYLAELSRRTALSVEIGLQSANPEVLRSVNRGHDVHSFTDAVMRLHVASPAMEIVAHVILGLPGESHESMLATADLLSSLPLHGVKIHQLMIVRGTALAASYAAGECSALSIGAYADILGGFLRRLRSDIIVHRIMADADDETGLVAPLWCADKRGSMNILRQQLADARIVQGDDVPS